MWVHCLALPSAWSQANPNAFGLSTFSFALLRSIVFGGQLFHHTHEKPLETI
jgi:hypothetical protein